MNATVKRNARGKWNVMVGDVVVSMKKNKRDAQALARDLARPVRSLTRPAMTLTLVDPTGRLRIRTPRRSCPIRRTSSINYAGHIRRRRFIGSAFIFCARILCVAR